MHSSKHQSIKFIIASVFLFAVVLMFSVAHAAKPVFNFNRIILDKRLDNAVVLDLLQDRQGFIWAATQNGLFRFDGYQFKSFKHDSNDPKSLAQSYVQSLYQSQQGILWVGTRGGVLHKYDTQTETFTRYPFDPEYPNTQVSTSTIFAMAEAADGDLWVATFGGGLSRFDVQSATFIANYRHIEGDFSSLSGNRVYSVLVDKNSVVWAGTRNGGLNRFDPTSQSFERFHHDPDNPASLSHNRVYKLLEDLDGSLWVGTRGGGLNRFDRKPRTFERYVHDLDNPNSLGSNQVFALSQDKGGILWVGTKEGGLHRFDKAQKHFERYQYNPQSGYSLPDNDVESITQDNNGLIWLGTFGGGIVNFDPQSQRFGAVEHDILDANSLSEGTVRATYKDRDGIVWIGTSAGLNRYDREKGEFGLYRHNPDDPHSISGNDVWSIFEDSSRNLWVGTRTGGLNKLNRQTGRFTRYRHADNDNHSLTDDYILAIAQDQQGNIWIGTDNGLNRFNPQSNNFTRFVHSSEAPDSLAHDYVLALYKSLKGEFWIGTLGGLNQLNDNGRNFTRYQQDQADPHSLSHNEVNAIDEDSQGNLWLATNGGLNKMDVKTQSFSHYREKDGLSNNRVYGVMSDAQDNIWFGADEVSFMNTSTGRIKNNVGAAVHCRINQGSHFQAADGEMFFGGDGYCSFYPQQVLRPSKPPAVVFSDFRLLNKSVPIATESHPSPLDKVINHTESITLTYQDNVLSFEFAALHFADPQSNQYQYKLEGFNPDWIETDATKRHATYTNLAPGDYTFKVKASNNEGVWNEQGRSIKLHIESPPWLSWWAYIIYAMLIASGVLAFVRGQRKKVDFERKLNVQLKQVDKLKDEFLANTSHELRTPLNGIIGLAESLMDGVAGQLPNKANHNLAMVVASGKRLANLVNDILDFSKLKNHALELHTRPVDVHCMTDVVLTLSRPLMGDKKLKLVNTVAKTLPAVQADEDRLQQILHNLVGNAIKFTEQGTVTVSAQVLEGWLEVSVTDTGIGIAKDKFTTIFESFEQVEDSSVRVYGGTGLGLAVSKKLVGLHGGTIKVASTLGQGSTFSFTLPACSQDVYASAVESIAVSRLHWLESQVDTELESKAYTTTTNGTRFRILLVDDEPVNRQVLHNHLSVQNYELTEASDGMQALEAIEKHGPFDLVLLDIMMPRMSGYEVCKKIRENHAVNDLPVIFLTAKNQVASLVQSFAVGANDYLSKPVAKHELLTRVETHLRLLDINRNLEHKVAERTAELEQSNQSITALSEINAEISATLDLNKLLNRVYRHIKTLMAVDVFSIGLFDAGRDGIVFKLALESDQRLPEFFVPMAQKDRLAVWCIEHQLPMIINDLVKDFPTYFGDMPLPQPQVGKQAESLMYWPLSAGEKVIGVLTVQSYQKNAYNEHHQDMIHTLASTTAIALDNANAYREVGDKNREILATQQQLVQSEKMASMGTMTAGVAHEINNPTNFTHAAVFMMQGEITGIKTFLEQLAGGEEAEQSVLQSIDEQFAKLIELTETATQGTARIKTIVDDLRAFTGLEDVRKQQVQVAEIIGSVAHASQIQYQHIEIDTQVEFDPLITCCAVKLSQVFMSLVVNSCQALDNSQKQGKVSIYTKQVHDKICIAVEDNGSGMDEQTLKRVFEPFFTTKAVGSGIGLGLTISFAVIQEHGGTIELKSTLGQGCLARVYLPLSL